MAIRDKLRGVFGGLYGSHLGNRQWVALGDVLVLDALNGIGMNGQDGSRNSGSLGNYFGRDITHKGLSSSNGNHGPVLVG